MTLDEALQGKDIPGDIRAQLELVRVPFLSFSGDEREGELVVHKELASDVREIFARLFKQRFPIEKMTPVNAYDWDDDRSMADNNTSAFNYRTIFGLHRLSNHSFGRAIDINPMQNPYVRLDGKSVPTDARYDVSAPGTVTGAIADIFKSFGWEWGGEWLTPKDWQHFQKP